MKLNEKIAYYRRDKKMSQEELAAQVGVSRQAVSKWELGEATPDVGKLLSLAKAFGVTTDHLLNDEEGPEREVPPPQAAPTAPPPPPASQPEFLSNLPGFIGKMVRRWGWLAGIYIALQGLGVTLVSALARWGFASMFSTSHQMMNGFGGFGMAGGGWAYSGPPELEEAFMEAAGIVPQTTPLSGMEKFFLGFPTVFLVIGVLMFIGGLALAVALWFNGKKGE